MKKRIFLHVPKTGGTTLDCALNKSEWMVAHDPFFYRHIQNDTKLSNAGDVFIKANFQKYKDFDIYSMLRHPVDRLISEYYFVRDRKEFFSLIKSKPKNLKAFAQSKQTRNYMTSFYLGKRIYAQDQITRDQLERVKEYILEYPIYVGILEEYERSLNYFSDKMNIKWPKKIEAKRMTLNRPHLEEVTQEIKDILLENNQLDLELYEFCLAILNEHKFSSSKNFKFNNNKYGYVMKYTERFHLYDLYATNASFFTANKSFFQDLNMAIKSHTNFSDGEKYVNSWNKTLIRFMKEMDDSFSINWEEASASKIDPLDLTKKLVKNIEEKKSVKKLVFDYKKIEIVDTKIEKKSFWGKLFGK